MLTTTDNLARSYNVTPFEIMGQDCDDVILFINYLLRKAENAPQHAPAVANDREESAAFWAAL